MTQTLLISQVQKLLDKKFEALGSLDDFGAKAIMFYLEDVMKIKRYRLDFDTINKEVVIYVFAADDTVVFVRNKKQKELDEMALYFGIKDYRVRFATKEEVVERTNELAGI